MSHYEIVESPFLEARARKEDPVSGILTFIVADLIVFSLLFIGFMVDRREQLDLFSQSAATLDVTFGIANTLLLVSSGLFMVFAVNAAGRGDASRFRRWVAVALLVGCGFGASKLIEYGHKFDAGINMLTNDFYMFYFALTGAHFLHFLGGAAALIYIWLSSYRKPVNGEFLGRIEAVGLYWHMVDLLWILIFPLLYLVGVL